MLILTGAGISAESGLDTFRAQEGLWEKHPIEQVATPEGFAADPALVNRFYNERRRSLGNVEPNTAHYALMKLEEQLQDTFCLITQNVDDLHERAGNRRVLHMHGSLRKSMCQYCQSRENCNGDIRVTDSCSRCGKSGGMRPDIVWFGEIPYHMDEIYRKLQNCNYFAAIGTSSNVYPAAGFVRDAQKHGAECFEVNMETTPMSRYFQRGFYGQASVQVPLFVENIMGVLT
ncbi:MAG: NAD-dependent deacylase [Salinispira sp.]